VLDRINYPPTWLVLFIAAAWGIARLSAPWGEAAAAAGWALVAAGLALILGSPLALMLLAPLQQVLLRVFVLREEAIIEGTLGQSYCDYKARVLRWI